MMKNTMVRWLTMLLLLTAFLAGTLPAGAANTFTTTEGCKDLENEGIEFSTGTAFSGTSVEQFRDRIQVEILDPSGAPYIGSTDNVSEVALYAASDGTEYQCQQLLTDSYSNSFSCNSFPSSASINVVHVTFIPNFSGTGTSRAVIIGDYTIRIKYLNSTGGSSDLLTGTATIDATSTACAQNQGTDTFYPPTGTNAFIYSTGTCAASTTQTINFVESSTNPFRIVSFPLNETITPSRLKLLVTPETSAFNYTFTLNFTDSASNALTVTYTYTKGQTASIDHSSATGSWSTATLPIKLTGGTLKISDPVVASLPTQTDFTLTFYYQNVDLTKGYENSMFHFIRKMSVQFANQCNTNTANAAYAVSSVAYDYCKSSSQSFSLSFVDTSTGSGIPLVTGTNTEVDIFNWTSGDRPAAKDVYFMTRRCSDATCNTFSDSDGAYVSSVTVSDAWATETTYGATETLLNTLSKIPMYVFQKSGTNPFTLRRLTLVAPKPGTYIISAFKNTRDSNMDPSSKLLLYITIPQVDSELSCYTPGNAGRFDAAWNGCNEDFDTETIEFKAQNDKVAFISNYSNKTLTFPLDAAASSMPTPLVMNELYCEWQVLAEGYSTSGGVCNPQYVTVPPYARAIVTGGKFTLNEKPKIEEADSYRVSYRREDTGNQMELIFDLKIKECPQEKIPDTGYSLRSPQTMSTAAQSNIIFTGNSIQIPAIGLGMETPIPIVHVYYVGETFENGWDLTMLGGYVGELEGGAYIPYSGNAVLTGHYYSQGVFVNLNGLKLEDEIIVYATDGMKYIYKVNNSFYTKPNDVWQLFQPNGEKSLTLVTCDSYNLVTDEYDKRYVVMAVLDHSEPYQ